MDWDQDGKLDILSGSYVIPGKLAGDLHFLRGKSDVEFEAAEVISNSKGNPVQNVDADSSDIQRCLINYCTHQHAIDFDEDGDLDLIVGSNKDGFFFHENLSEAGKPNSISANSKQLSICLPQGARHSAPHLFDWDGDGDLDLLSGSSAGGVILSKNSGTSKKPVWEPFESLVPFNPPNELEPDFQIGDVQLGGSTRVWVCDYNKDGLADLVVGDCVELNQLKAETAEAEYQEAVSAYNKLVDANEKGATLNQAKDKCERLLNRSKTGFVWVFLQEASTGVEKL